MGSLLKICNKSYEKRKKNELQHFQNIQKGLKEYMSNFNKAIDEIEDWDELLNLKEENIDNIKLMKTKTIKYEYKDRKKKKYYEHLGLVFCIFHLVGIQAAIIVLNSLYSEIVDEFELRLNKTPREYNFYEHLEINSYKGLPEIDVGMIASSVGIICMRSFGFYCSNITFQVLSLIVLLLLFLLFDFHTGDQLLNNYDQLELLIIILSYIFLSFTVGSSSTIALKEYFDFFTGVFSKNENKEDDEKPLFYLLSGISILIIMGVNRKIFTSIKPENSKLILISMIIVYVLSLMLSFIFHYMFLIPVRDIKKNENQEENKTKENQYITYNIKNGQKEADNCEYQINDINDVDIDKGSDRNIGNNKNKEIKSNQNENKNNDIAQPDKNKKKEIHSAKICTLCGYLYFQKKIGNKTACICYYYTDKCTWFREKFFKLDVIVPVLTELYCQLCILGYNSLLTEKLLKVYSFSKSFKFYLALIIISIFFGSLTPTDFEEIGNKKKDKERKKGILNCKFINDNFILIIFIYVFGFTLLTFISSICYLNEKNLSRGRWDNIIMAEFIYFKVIDMIILGFYNFFDNSDIFNTSLTITLEKFIWMIIETIIYASEPSAKSLVIAQIVFSSIGILFFLIINIFLEFIFSK